MITTLLIASLSAYCLTFVVASSSLFGPFRVWFMRLTPWLNIGSTKHMIECRMCMGFYMAIIVCNTDWKMILPAYGLSYFMAKQER